MQSTDHHAVTILVMFPVSLTVGKGKSPKTIIKKDVPSLWRTESGHLLFWYQKCRKADFIVVLHEFFSFSTFLLPEKQIEHFVKMHFLRFYFSVTRKAGFTFSPNAGGRKVAICMSATRIVEKQV